MIELIVIGAALPMIVNIAYMKLPSIETHEDSKRSQEKNKNNYNIPLSGFTSLISSLLLELVVKISVKMFRRLFPITSMLKRFSA